MKGPLGKKVAAPKKFDPKVLFPISRTDQRKGVFEKTDFSKIKGDDVWNILELLWIDKNNNAQLDDLYEKALEIVKSERKASTSFLQRKLQIGIFMSFFG